MIPTVLPPTRTLTEREVERSLHRVGEIDVDALRRMRDPALCSPEHLPFLAWGRGVDLWFDDWPEWKKRRITAEIYRLKGIKGTLPGIAGYLTYVDASLVESFLPPQGVIARSQGADALQAWRERFAEIRLYPYKVRDQRRGYMATGSGRVTLANVGTVVASANLSRLYYGRRATLVDHGVETLLRSIDQIGTGGSDLALGYSTFAISTLGRSYDASVGRGAVGHMAVAARGRGRLIVIAPDGRLGGAAVPFGFEGVRPLDIAPQRMFVRHVGRGLAPLAVGARQPATVGGMVAYASDAGRYIYDSWRLLDEARTAGSAHRTLGPVVGRMMAQLRPFNALLRVNARFAGSGRPATAGMWGVGIMTASRASDQIDRVGAAIYRAKSLRDTVMFTTKTYRPREIADLSFDQPVPWGGMVPINRSTL